MCEHLCPEDIAACVVEYFKRDSGEQYHEALEELRHCCSFDEDHINDCLRDAGLPDAMLKRARRRLIRGDAATARQLFNRAQRVFGTRYILGLDSKYGLSARIEAVAVATV